ncbi:MAG: FHA domain-containing protein [Myxococcales bacterium]|nr:FHA domain-containing protein [Myxococcales bacterium]
MSEWSPCPACGTENGASSSVCRICGYRLDAADGSDSHKCARCGAGLGAGFEFCQTCGLRVHSRRPRPVTSSLKLVQRGPGGEPQVGEIGDVGAAMGVEASGAQPVPSRTAEASHEVPSRMPEAPSSQTAASPPTPRPQGAASPPTPISQSAASPPTPQQAASFQSAPTPGSQSAASPPTPQQAASFQSAPTPAQPAASVPMQPAGQIAFTPEPQARVAAAAQGQGQPPAPPDWTPPEQTRPSPGQPSAPMSNPRRAPGANALRLVLVQRDGSEGEVVPLGDAPLTIGRTHADLRFTGDEFLEATHARIEPIPPARGELGGVRVIDLGTHNGVFLRISRPEAVYPGDLFLLGHHLLRLENVPPAGREQDAPHGVKRFGTPLLPAWGRLVLIGAGGAEAESHYLRHLQVVFGRELGDIVFPADPFVSWQHAQLTAEVRADGMGVTLTDLRSANGTYLRTRGDVILQPGDMFRVGDQIFRVRMH